MMKRMFVCLTLLLFSAAVYGLPPQSNNPKTIINDQRAKQMLLGQHRFSLQWISWDYFGKANITESKGTLFIKGEQKGRGNTDHLTLDGIITMVNEKEFTFKGMIITQVSHINNGESCKREGEMTFKITGSRKYWRLQEMNNPCEDVVDYVDVFFQ